MDPAEERATGRFPPARNEMPDLSALDTKNTLNTALDYFFRGKGVTGRVAGGLFASLVRLLDKAILEYESARRSLSDYVGPQAQMSDLFRALDHLETCVGSLDRATKMAVALQRLPSGPKICLRSLPSRNARTRLSRIRNGIEHADDDLVKGRIGDGKAIALLVKSDSIEINDVEINYAQLVAQIRALYALTLQLRELDLTETE